MTEKNTEEVIQTEQVAPVPETPTPAKVETAPSVAEPVESPAEKQDKKLTKAFIAQRQKIRELEKAAKAAPVATTPPVATPVEPVEAATTTTAPTQTAPTPVIVESGIEKLEKEALTALSEDKDMAKIPGSVIDVLEMIDNDPRLSRLYKEIDPTLAIKEAKSMYLSKAGVSAPATIPVSAPPSGGMGKGGQDLNALIANAEKHTPGTRDWFIAVAKVNAELKKQGI